MAEDSSFDPSFPVVQQEHRNIVSNVEEADKEQPVSTSSSSNVSNSNKLPTGKLEFSCCSKKGCQNVFTKTIGRIEDEKRRGIQLVFTTVPNAAIAQSILKIQLKQKHQLVCIHFFF